MIRSLSLLLTLVLAKADLEPADLASMLQKAPVQAKPHIIGLRRESVPVYRRGRIASFKTSYSGVLQVGQPAQELRVVFDTGSGNLVLPAAECKSEACLMPHRKLYSQRLSSTSIPINSDGSKVHANELGEQVTIGFGTGEITGEFAKERLCFGGGGAADNHSVKALDLVDYDPLCVEMSIIVAVEMSSQPFKSFQFDGILGLGLPGLTMSRNFSTFDVIVQSGLAAQPRFGVFLCDGEFGEESEVSFGGLDPRRVLEPISWSHVAMEELGYWQVGIRAIRIAGEVVEACADGTCRGVLDTGTSHLGVPSPYDKEFEKRLQTNAGELLDCRNADAPTLEIELWEGKIITLYPFNYMRRLPLRDGITVGSNEGVRAKSEIAPVSNAGQSEVMNDTEAVSRRCSPRLMSVKLPEPLGPKLFILGEPVLHRYYTVYDWEKKKVGFSLANSHRNSVDPAELRGQKGQLPQEVDMLLMQKTMKLGRSEEYEETVFLQVQISVSLRL
ncbi:Aspartic protease 4 [Durusdinium trenchii]|uniref:Aspartic protease 4 n=2 Tax=Durusdinium trenchii TaxID=1381693 RepID=A0ABP0IG37_9DINO